MNKTPTEGGVTQSEGMGVEMFRQSIRKYTHTAY